ncbi:MAG: hypothetical protein ACOX63_06945 [Christensenellales bacterium]
MAGQWKKWKNTREQKSIEKKRDKELLAVEKTNKPVKLKKIAMQSKFDTVQVAAIRRLQKLGAQAQILYLAQKGATPILRCEASCRLEDRAVASEFVSQDICAAFSDEGMTKAYSWQEWLAAVRGAETALAAYRAGADKNWHKFELPKALAAAHHDALRQLIIEEEDNCLEADRLIKAFTGTREDWREIAEKAHHQGTVMQAVRHLSAEDEDVLLQLAEADDTSAARRLVEINPSKYMERFVVNLDLSALEKAIRENKVSQKAFEKLAFHYPICEKGIFHKEIKGNSVANAALDNLTD